LSVVFLNIFHDSQGQKTFYLLYLLPFYPTASPYCIIFNHILLICKRFIQTNWLKRQFILWLYFSKVCLVVSRVLMMQFGTIHSLKNKLINVKSCFFLRFFQTKSSISCFILEIKTINMLDQKFLSKIFCSGKKFLV
jgi:hypothetical protein